MGLLLIPIPLPISAQYAITAARLPPVHRDPFDRMLVAQAIEENLTLVTRDPQCQRYDVDVRPVRHQPAQLPVRNSQEIPIIITPERASDIPASHRRRPSQTVEAAGERGLNLSSTRATKLSPLVRAIPAHRL
jgi:hypothetical protein